MKRKTIYVMMSFKAGRCNYLHVVANRHPREQASKVSLGPMEITEKGKLYWFRSEKLAREYLEMAGRSAGGGAYYDDPFECRWDWAMIEEVHEGPLPPPGKIVALYKVSFRKGNCQRFTKREIKKIPKWLSGYGYTI